MTNIEFILQYLRHTTLKDGTDPSEIDHNYHITMETKTPTEKGSYLRFIVSANSESPNGDALMLQLYDYTDCELYEPGVPEDARWDVDKMDPYLSIDNVCAQLVYPLDVHDDEREGEYVISSFTGKPVTPYKLLWCEPWLLEEFLG